jgi:SAM-dependent methyltransferase
MGDATDTPSRWQHGGEEDTARALDAAQDLSDMSDELAELGASGPAAFDCARERGHLLRVLDLRADMRVLEVGAGCGAVTRSLAERCGVVDALEPNPVRARLAERRLAGLESARVVVGEIDDIPAEPAYDLIVIVGVLEYVGGWRGHDERVRFLRDLASRLRPGGHIACAIENRLGVRYFAGHPDDHTGLLFQGPEDHPRPYPARTYARAELEALFASAGLHPTTLGVFPDYRLPRLVLSQALLESAARPLAWRVPRFPTPPHPNYASAAVMDEYRLWQGFVRNGIGMEFANSFLVLAGRDAAQTLWSLDLLAAFYSAGRRRRFATESRVVATAAGIELQRRPLGTGDTSSDLVHRCDVEPYRDGTALIELLAEADDDELAAWLRRYRAQLDAELAAVDGDVPFDHWPGNVLVVDGELVPVDTEFALRGMDPRLVIWRGLLLTAFELAERTMPERWKSTTRAELIGELARAAGIDEPVPLAGTIALQAAVAAEIFGGEPGSEAWTQRREHEVAALASGLEQPLTARDGLGARLAEMQRCAEQLEAEQRERARLASQLATIERSKSWRLTAALRAARRR